MDSVTIKIKEAKKGGVSIFSFDQSYPQKLSGIIGENRFNKIIDLLNKEGKTIYPAGILSFLVFLLLLGLLLLIIGIDKRINAIDMVAHLANENFSSDQSSNDREILTLFLSSTIMISMGSIFSFGSIISIILAIFLVKDRVIQRVKDHTDQFNYSNKKLKVYFSIKEDYKTQLVSNGEYNNNYSIRNNHYFKDFNGNCFKCVKSYSLLIEFPLKENSSNDIVLDFNSINQQSSNLDQQNTSLVPSIENPSQSEELLENSSQLQQPISSAIAFNNQPSIHYQPMLNNQKMMMYANSNLQMNQDSALMLKRMKELENQISTLQNQLNQYNQQSNIESPNNKSTTFDNNE